MLVSATEMLKKAKEGHYAVGQFNINNLEWTKSIEKSTVTAKTSLNTRKKVLQAPSRSVTLRTAVLKKQKQSLTR